MHFSWNRWVVTSPKDHAELMRFALRPHLSLCCETCNVSKTKIFLHFRRVTFRWVRIIIVCQWFLNFSWSRTIFGSRTVTTYHLVPGQLNLPNMIRSKVWKIYTNWHKCDINKICVRNYNGHFQNPTSKVHKNSGI